MTGVNNNFLMRDASFLNKSQVERNLSRLWIFLPIRQKNYSLMQKN